MTKHIALSVLIRQEYVDQLEWEDAAALTTYLRDYPSVRSIECAMNDALKYERMVINAREKEIASHAIHGLLNHMNRCIEFSLILEKLTAIHIAQSKKN